VLDEGAEQPAMGGSDGKVAVENEVHGTHGRLRLDWPDLRQGACATRACRLVFGRVRAVSLTSPAIARPQRIHPLSHALEQARGFAHHACALRGVTGQA
jgi:hypothetical protein